MSMPECQNTKPARTFTFERVEVYVTPANEKIIQWWLDRCFPMDSAVPVFFIEVSRAAGEWERLNPDAPVADHCVYVDRTNYRCGKDNDVFYRVVAFDGTTEFVSQPEAMLGVWNKHDFLISRDVVRQEYLMLRKFTGTLGYLLKRRTHGVPCQNPACLDHDLKIPTTTACPNCYGTGFQNGYYNGLPYYIDLSAFSSNKDVTQPIGTTDNRSRLGRAVAYPRVDEYDIWVDADKNKRYVIRGEVERLVEIKGKPLVYKLKLNEISVSNVVYRIPLEQNVPVPEGESSGSPDLPKQGGWQRGISYVEW